MNIFKYKIQVVLIKMHFNIIFNTFNNSIIIKFISKNNIVKLLLELKFLYLIKLFFYS